MLKVQSIGQGQYSIQYEERNAIPQQMILKRGDAIELYCKLDVLFYREKKQERAALKKDTDKELAEKA